MQKEVGSNFWLNPYEKLTNSPLEDPSQFGCNGSDYVWLSTGRSAIKLVLEEIKEENPNIKKIAVLPPFTCHTVIEPFIDAGYEVYYYDVDEKLETTDEIILKCVKTFNPSIVFLHRYYGFDTIKSVEKLYVNLRECGIISIEDCTQCLYSEFLKTGADFFVGSIRKWTGTPDGGFAVRRKGVFHIKPILSDVELETAKVNASYSKYRYLFENQGEKSSFLQQYREAEEILSSRIKFYMLSETSAQVQSNLDVSSLKDKRRNNFCTLLQYVNNSREVEPLFHEMDTDVVPLYFPIVVSARSLLQSHLVQHSIFAPVVWPKANCLGEICDKAEYLYQHLLCIPIDQRYDTDDMLRIASIINNFYQK